MITLAVDDRMAIAQQVADMMREIDPDGTHLAEQVQETALEVIRSNRPDVVWLDIEMPGMSGLTMAAEIKKLSPDTNIVFVTGYPEYAMDAFGLHVSGFVLKPVTKERILEELDELRHPVKKTDNKLLQIQCFGNFEVFRRGGLVKFSRAMSKEALAYLVDRRGAGCTVGEICSVLWEDRSADTKLKSQCRVIMGALKKDLTAVGAGDVLVKMWNVWSIDPNKISCDYYDFLRRDSDAINSFRGEYMTQYSWAEMTIGNLYDISEENIEI